VNTQNALLCKERVDNRMHEYLRSDWMHRMHKNVRSEWTHRLHEVVVSEWTKIA